MTELSPLVAAFRRDALAILERRNSPSGRVPVRDGHILIQPLSRGVRIDVMGRDDGGKSVRLATTHYSNISQARSMARKLGNTMGLQVREAKP
jgi:hypothetical protein